MFRWFQPCKDVTNDGAESIDSNLSLVQCFTVEATHTHTQIYAHTHSHNIHTYIRAELHALEKEHKEGVHAMNTCIMCVHV